MIFLLVFAFDCVAQYFYARHATLVCLLINQSENSERKFRKMYGEKIETFL